MWEELARAFALMLVIEGFLPFLYPGRWRALVIQLAGVEARTLRMAGLACMIAGVVLLGLLN
ncbi:DUF2065 domain-containing protein [Biformimicrobium ophioploci]|uniref:DUF2065 domain-containing protein n=1 Tax=Biformimicrobium ophioploci TaxID=3036711 RepID=A0ABQ6LUW5_9GAMM|nr:DUF2065 domain-containing protein [Microbulbifer sp. NKW57]GMG85877.1 hypothetical protein MNKW57_01980 [Microbulbifer sp. NKW57]